jgi:hypothetical protein
VITFYKEVTVMNIKKTLYAIAIAVLIPMGASVQAISTGGAVAVGLLTGAAVVGTAAAARHNRCCKCNHCRCRRCCRCENGKAGMVRPAGERAGKRMVVVEEEMDMDVE